MGLTRCYIFILFHQTLVAIIQKVFYIYLQPRDALLMT